MLTFLIYFCHSHQAPRSDCSFIYYNFWGQLGFLHSSQFEGWTMIVPPYWDWCRSRLTPFDLTMCNQSFYLRLHLVSPIPAFVSYCYSGPKKMRLFHLICFAPYCPRGCYWKAYFQRNCLVHLASSFTESSAHLTRLRHHPHLGDAIPGYFSEFF